MSHNNTARDYKETCKAHNIVNKMRFAYFQIQAQSRWHKMLLEMMDYSKETHAN